MRQRSRIDEDPEMNAADLDAANATVPPGFRDAIWAR
jgi:hypothetical protein